MKKQIKVAYFPSNTEKNKVLSSNGKSLDRYCIKCIPDEDVSTGNYIVDLKFLIDDNIQDLLQEEVILKVLLDYGNEIFRISKVTVGTRYIDVVARQITIADSLTLWLEDVRPTNLNGQAAVSWLLDKAEGKKEIQIVSDIDTVATAYYQRISLYKALHDNDNSFLNRWGGEVQRRGYTIYINKRIGTDRGFTIREGKNLTGFESTSNIDKLVTRARGQGYNGILGNYIDSPLIGSYNRIYTSVIKYDDVKVKDEYSEEGYDDLEQAQSELDRRIEEEFSKNDIDKIKASYTINFVQLEKTEEYKNYVVAERLFIGDDCRVYLPKLNIDIKVRAMSKKYDVLAQKTKEIKLSNYIEAKPLSIKQITERLESMDSTETILQIAKDNATALIKGGLKNSYVIVRENEILIMDTKDINTATNVWRWNAGGLGHSSNGYYGTYGTAITQDGAIVADFITTGVLNAALIKTGLITSTNGRMVIDVDNGIISNGANGYSTIMDRGGHIFQSEGENVGAVRSSSFPSNRNINGLSMVAMEQGDYVDIGYTDSSEIDENSTFIPVIRYAKSKHELLGNFIGIQLKANTRLDYGSALYFKNNSNYDYDSIMYASTGGHICSFGDNGLVFGYREGDSNTIAMQINETAGSSGSNIYMMKQMSMQDQKIVSVPDIYVGSTGIRYYHEGWVGSIEKIAKRISNLNVLYDTGVYSFSNGSNGAPCQYGTLIHIKWGSSGDASQLVIELVTGKLFTRATSHDVSSWSAWTEK
ncbi:phage tail spike protein [Clostridium disporicum]|uniref:phage tail spike protein n=3 Tax=Clostridium TaxID=1485 RepID=UPI0034A1BB87